MAPAEVVKIENKEEFQNFILNKHHSVVFLPMSICDSIKLSAENHGFETICAVVDVLIPESFPQIIRLVNCPKVAIVGGNGFRLSERAIVPNSNLRELVVEDCILGDVGAEAIAVSLTGLTALDLSRNGIGDAGAEAIAWSLTGLTSLDLSRNSVGDAGAEAIAGLLTRLTSLNFSHNKIDDTGAETIAWSLTELTSLRLAGNGIGDAGAEAIAGSLIKLTSLDLSGNSIGDVGTEAIAGSLTGLTSLDLSHNSIGDVGAEAIAGSLTGLASLDLSGNSIGDVGAEAIAGSLTGQASLDLSHNSIGDVGAEAIAGSLTGLTSLDLSANNIEGAGARAIAKLLTGLTSLNLSANNIGNAGAKAIAGSLTGLTFLDLSRNSISDAGAEAIAESLTGLTSLRLSMNDISNAGVEAIAGSLTGLTTLILSGNGIGDDGAKAIAGSLTGLTALHLSGNRIGDAGAEAIAASLTELSSLLLSYNNIGDDGAKAIAGSLAKLTLLHLSRNSIGDAGAQAIAESLTGLIFLDLANNDIDADGIRSLLDGMLQVTTIRTLNLQENPGTETVLTPESFASSDAQAILAAWRSFIEARISGRLGRLNEAKLLVVGNEAVGKTSLIRFLLHDDPRDPDERKTPGIRHHERIQTETWSPERSDIKLNVWDFGGQEIMHGTHRYFLTERSIYLLVLEDRREDDPPVDPWMKVIESLGADSPVIIVINKSDEGKQALQLDINGLKRKFPQIVDFIRTSCNDDAWSKYSIDTLRKCISKVLLNDERLEHVRNEIPASWLAVKQAIEDRARAQSVLEQDAFRTICADRDIVGDDPVIDADEQRALLRQLHELGVVIAHGLERDAPAVQQGITLLDPNWLTHAIYTVLSSAKIQETGGEFSLTDMKEWLDPKIYPPGRHEFILSMMRHKEVGLCFRLPDIEDHFLAPEALPKNSPDFRGWEEGALRFRYSYSQLPHSLIPRFIVQTHKNLTEPRTVWRTGARLNIENSEVLVQANRADKVVDVAIKGDRCREALAVVRYHFDQLHSVFADLDVSEFILVPDDPNVEESYEHLRNLERQMGPDYVHWPRGAKRGYRVSELLDNIIHVREYRGINERLKFKSKASPSIETSNNPPMEDGDNSSAHKLIEGLAPWVPAAMCSAAGIITSLITWIELSLSILWAMGSGLVVFGLVRFLLRMFDRGFIFRRVFISWSGFGFGIIGLSSLALAINIPGFSLDWGSPPTLIVAGMWTIGLLVFAGLAFWEAHVSGRS